MTKFGPQLLNGNSVENDHRYKLLVNGAIDYAIFMLDVNGCVVSWTLGAEKITGYRESEIVNKSYTLLFTAADRAAGVPEQELWDAQRTGRAGDTRWLVGKDGRLVWAEGVLTEMRDAHGVLIGFSKICRDVTEQKRTLESLAAHDQRLQAALKEKELMMREIHHRVKNNLQVVASLLSIQSRRATDPDVCTFLNEVYGRIWAIADIHEKLYNYENLAGIPFGVYLERLARDLQGVYAVHPHQIQLHVESDEVFLGINQAFPLGLILNELVCNAFKHAFPHGRRGHIEVSLRAGPQQPLAGHAGSVSCCELVVADNGIGLDADFCETDSIGAQLIVLLVDQLHGTLTVDGHAGAAFAIRFPVPALRKNIHSANGIAVAQAAHLAGQSLATPAEAGRTVEQTPRALCFG